MFKGSISLLAMKMKKKTFLPSYIGPQKWVRHRQHIEAWNFLHNAVHKESYRQKHNKLSLPKAHHKSHMKNTRDAKNLEGQTEVPQRLNLLLLTIFGTFCNL